MTAIPRIPLTLVTGPSAALREAAIAAALRDGLRTEVILEGLPDGASSFGDPLPAWLMLTRIAPGCICCSGNLVMRVTLNRILRRHPERIFLSLAVSDHLLQIRQFLTLEPYAERLSLTKELVANSRSSSHGSA